MNKKLEPITALEWESRIYCAAIGTVKNLNL